MKYLLRFILILFAIMGFFTNTLFAQTFQFDSGTNTSWVVPNGVTSVKVEVWGGGGRGGSFSGASGNTGGGGGGAYSSSVINVTSGTTYYYTVGVGSSSTAAGGDSWFSTTTASSGALVLAKGGSSAATNASTGAAGGIYSTSIGNDRNNGGRGADGSTSGGGGGGSSAGATGLGVNATNQFGAVGPTGNDGIGGNGGASGGNNAGAVGVAPGGGGGGAFRTSNGNTSGGNGANGRVVITIMGPQLNFTTTGSVVSWVAPAGATSIEVETWGGGGRGGGRTNGSSAYGGGGGGAYSSGIVSVTPGQTYYINVGSGATSTSAGNDSWFNMTNTAPTTNTYVLAKGGISVPDNTTTGALGGASGSGYGNLVKYSGGRGANGSGSNGGGGGSSASQLSDGSTANSSTGGAVVGGGTGGNGRTGTSGNGLDGLNPGGGGGGAYRTSGGGSPTGGNGADGKVTIHTFYNLSIAKTVSNTAPLVGTNVTFTLTVTNNGTNTAKGIVVTDAFPTGINYVSNTGSATFNTSTKTLTWNVGTLAPATTASITFVGAVNTSGNYANTANLVANVTNTGISSSMITLFPQQPTADLQLNKEVNNVMPLVSGQVVFTLTAYNAGPQNATGVKVEDILPFGFTHVSNSGGFTPSTGIWTIGNLNKGVTQTLTITATVNTSGNYYNQAVISGDQIDPNETNNTSGIRIYPMYPIIEVVLPCATTNYNLNNFTIATPPSGSQVSWHTASPASDSNKIATPTNVRAGQVYYVAFYNTADNCYGATSQVLIKRSCLVTNPMIRQRTK